MTVEDRCGALRVSSTRFVRGQVSLALKCERALWRAVEARLSVGETRVANGGGRGQKRAQRKEERERTARRERFGGQTVLLTENANSQVDNYGVEYVLQQEVNTRTPACFNF
jgi:hypothetical protein